jgi:hypothetical protein
VKASTKAVPTTHTVSTGHTTAMSASAVSAPAMSTTTATTTSRCDSRGKSDRNCGGGRKDNKSFSKHGTVSS